jgi:hypothetical protein
MATVQLADIIDVKVFQDLPAVNGVEKTAFFESGIVTSSPLLNGLASAAGKIAELPFWNDIDESSAPNISSSDPATSATPIKVTQSEQISRKANLNKGFSASDLASELAMGPRAMEHIRARTDRYWMRQWQRRLIASANGVLADNVAANSSDMVYNVAGATNAAITANTVFTRANFTTAAFSMGDMVDGITAIAVHSTVMKRMTDNNDIDFIRDSEGNILLATYLGRRIIMDDTLPYTPAAGSGGADAAPQYTSILFGPGAFGYGEGAPLNPVEIQREAAQGNGAGVETLWTRKTWILHPFGYQNTGTPAGEGGFNTTELAAATSWARVVARKNVPIAFLVTNG